MEACWGWDSADGTLWDTPSCHTSPARLPLRSRSRSIRGSVCSPDAASASSASAWHSWPSPLSPSPQHSARNIIDTLLNDIKHRKSWISDERSLHSPLAAPRGTPSSFLSRSDRTTSCCPHSAGCSWRSALFLQEHQRQDSQQMDHQDHIHTLSKLNNPILQEKTNRKPLFLHTLISV